MSYIQAWMSTPEGAMAVYVGVGVVILLIGQMMDTALAGRANA